MSSISHISNLISSIKVALKHKKYTGVCVSNRINRSILEFLTSKGIIEQYKEFNKDKISVMKFIKFKVCVYQSIPNLYDIKLISKPGLKVYSSYRDINQYTRFHRDVVVSTNKGLMSGKECKLSKLGGKVLFVYT